MKQKYHFLFILSGCLLLVFVLWTFAISLIDVQVIGPLGSAVGFAAWNNYVHQCIGMRPALYILTDMLSLIPFGFVLGFAILGLVQWIRRGSVLSVDHSILLLGGFYLVVMGIYVLFEYLAINYRPVLIEGILEVSYPSSTTVLVICVMETGAIEWKHRIQNPRFQRSVSVSSTIFTLLMIVGRFFSGVHWVTDILGGVFLSAGLVLLYRGFRHLLSGHR